MEKYSIKENVSKNVFTKSGFYNKPFRFSYEMKGNIVKTKTNSRVHNLWSIIQKWNISIKLGASRVQSAFPT